MSAARRHWDGDRRRRELPPNVRELLLEVAARARPLDALFE